MITRTTTTPPTYTLTAEARWFLRLPILPPALLLKCAMSTSRNPAWRISFCTTPEGACANELEDFSSPAGARCSWRSPQLRSFAAADFLAADDVRVYLRPGDGEQRLYARRVQEPALARDHGDQHGVHGCLGGRDAVDCRISVYSRDRRPPAGADRNLLAGHRESNFRCAASTACRPRGHPRSVAAAASGRGIEHAFSAKLCLRYAARGALLGLWRSCSRLQHKSDAHRSHVLSGFN